MIKFIERLVVALYRREVAKAEALQVKAEKAARAFAVEAQRMARLAEDSVSESQEHRAVKATHENKLDKLVEFFK